MDIDISYSFINLLAFNAILKYENKRVLSINILNKYREKLLEEVKKIYEAERLYGNNTYFLPQDDWKGTVTFVKKDEDVEMNAFLEQFSDLFYRKDDEVYLKDSVDYDILASKIEEVRHQNNLGMRFDAPSTNSTMQEVLGISSISEQLKKYIKVEEKLESLYKSLGLNNGNSNEINGALIIKGLVFYNIKSFPGEVISAFKDISGQLVLDDSECNYDEEPLNLDLWEKYNYYDNEDFLGDVESFIYDLYIYAIFGETTLKYKKLHGDLLKLFYDFDGVVDVTEAVEEFFENGSECDDYFCDDFGYDYDGIYENDDVDEEDYDVDEEDEKEFSNIYCDICEERFNFYLNYIDKLNKYMEVNGCDESLLTTRNRLLYAIDEPNLCLYKKDNFKNEFEKSKNIKFDEGAFNFLENESRFMMDEVFSDNDEKRAIKKLLFISTYYQLTGDDAIKEIIFKHCCDDKFDLYANLVFGEENGYSKKIGNTK